MLIIDNIKEKSPILVHKPKPTFRTALEKERYWEKEKIKWIEGIGDIPGTLYHKTQEQWIKDRNSGEILRPICRDADLLIHQTIRDCRREGEALVLIKGRGLGLSVEFGCLTNYFMRVYPGTTSLITSQEKTKIAALFSEKIAFTYDKYDEDIKPVQINRNETTYTAGIKVEISYKDKYGNVQTNISQAICRDTSDRPESASAFSGQGAILGCYDELFLHKRRKELIRSSASCYIDQKTKQTTGFLFCGGTVEDTLTNEQLSELQVLIREVQTTGRLGTMKARLLFIPAWMGTFMTNGWSDERKAKEYWEKEIEALDKLEDKSAVRAYKMNNPMSMDDIFQMTGGGKFEEDVIEKVKEQKKIILSQNIPITKCKLIDMGHTVKSTVDFKNGNIHVLEEPKQSVSYFLVIDGVATGKKSGSEKGSNVAGTIVKAFDPSTQPHMPVCIYTERPETVEQSYINLLAQAKYYNQYGGLKGIMAEGNAGNADHFFTFLQKNGYEKYAMVRQDLSGKGIVNTNKTFQYVTSDIRDYQMKQANMFLRKYIDSIKMVMLLDDMLKPLSENADILDSWLMYFVANKDYDKPFVQKITKIKTPTYTLSRDSSGRTVWVEKYEQ